MDRNRKLSTRAKLRNDKIQKIKQKKYEYFNHDSAEKHNDWKSKFPQQTTPNSVHSLDWEDFCLETGEIRQNLSSSEEEEIEISPYNLEEEEELKTKEKEKIKNAEELENSIKKCGLDEMKRAFDAIQLKYQIDLGPFMLTASKSIYIMIEPEPSAYFLVEQISEYPPAVIFLIKQIPGKEKRQKKEDDSKKQTKVHSADNSFRKAIIFKKESRYFLIHCGITTYTNETLLKYATNINSLLKIAPSRITVRRLYYEIDITCMGVTDLEPASRYQSNEISRVPIKIEDIYVLRRLKTVSCSFSM